MSGNPELVIGNINDSGIEEMLSSEQNRNVTERKLEDIEDCPDCFAVEACAVNCANRSYSKSKDFYSKISLCEYYKDIIPKMMWKIYEDPGIIKNIK